MAFRSSMLLTGFLTLAARFLNAQAPAEVFSAESFGPGDQELYIGAAAFRERHDSDTRISYLTGADGYLYRVLDALALPNGEILAPLRLPAGAKIHALCLYAFDQNPSGTVRLQWDAVKLAPAGQPAGVVPIASLQTHWDFGHGVVCADITPAYTYHESGDVDGDGLVEHVSHRLVADIEDVENLGLGGVGVFWRREVSPAPRAAAFLDVATTHPYFQHIEALFDSGITAGCASGFFCPSRPITRGEMAVFLAKALGLHWPY